MPRHTTRPPSGNSSPRPRHRAVYGPGVSAGGAAAFKRSKGLCQHCGLRPAVEAHHYALKYPDDSTVTADDLTALCLLCHWSATFRRALDRAMGAGTWVILAAATRPAGGRRPAPRHQPRACGPEPEGPGLDIQTLVDRYRLQLFVGCLACERFVKLDGVTPFKRCGWRVPVRDLRRRLFCCKCHSRTRWVLLGAWPPAGGGTPPRAGQERHVRDREALTI